MLFDYPELPAVDQLLANIFVIDDQTREYISDTLANASKKHADPERKKKLKKV